MADKKIRLTKNELQKQQRELKKFQRFLPTLQLKKQQLQVEVRTKQAQLAELKRRLERFKDQAYKWSLLLSEYSPKRWRRLISLKEIVRDKVNIAGVRIPVLHDVSFVEEEYSLIATPVWLESAIEELRRLMRLTAEEQVTREALEMLQKELRKTTQRVNLFEKVMIPRCEENIRIIKIYLGDQERNQVARAKIAKRKIIAKRQPSTVT